jgi:hypothetical protein
MNQTASTAYCVPGGCCTNGQTCSGVSSGTCPQANEIVCGTGCIPSTYTCCNDGTSCPAGSACSADGTCGGAAGGGGGASGTTAAASSITGAGVAAPSTTVQFGNTATSAKTTPATLASTTKGGNLLSSAKSVATSVASAVTSKIASGSSSYDPTLSNSLVGLVFAFFGIFI